MLDVTGYAEHCIFEQYSLCSALQFVPIKYRCVLNSIMCAEHYSLCWTSQFFFSDGWNFSWILQFFALIFATFNAATGRAARGAWLYGFGHPIIQEWGTVPCCKSKVQRRWMCGNWDFVTSCLVWFWFVMWCYEWLRRVLGSNTT